MISGLRQTQRIQARGQTDQENRSIFCEDLLNGRYPNMNLVDIAEHVWVFARDRHGSECIQNKLKNAYHQDKLFIFHAMQPNLLAFMTDRYAHNIVRNFIEIGTIEQRQEILILIQTHFMALSQHSCGCFVVQQAIEYITITKHNQQHDVFKQFYGPNILTLARDAHGNHVVQCGFRSAMDSIQVRKLVEILRI